MAGVSGRVALVTGAGSAGGIGFACAEVLAEHGASLAVTSTTARIHDRLRQLGGGHRAYVADLTDPVAARALVMAVRKDFGRLDIIINNAGMVQTGRKFRASRVEKITDDEWQRHLALNVTTALNVVRAALPIMQKASYGRIVNIASVTGPVVTNPRAAGYGSAKAAMTGLTRAVAVENAASDITCNAVLPGWIASVSQSAMEVIAGQAAPARRSGTPREVAACAMFLASEESSYVTGAMLVVDGGNSIVEFKGAPADWY